VSEYSGSKAALRAFTWVFTAALLSHGIRVNAVSPGLIRPPTMGITGASTEELAAFRAEGQHGHAHGPGRSTQRDRGGCTLPRLLAPVPALAGNVAMMASKKFPPCHPPSGDALAWIGSYRLDQTTGRTWTGRGRAYADWDRADPGEAARAADASTGTRSGGTAIGVPSPRQPLAPGTASLPAEAEKTSMIGLPVSARCRELDLFRLSGGGAPGGPPPGGQLGLLRAVEKFDWRKGFKSPPMPPGGSARRSPAGPPTAGPGPSASPSRRQLSTRAQHRDLSTPQRPLAH
jgi:Enoyl-(Acyl carrier protein) reductase